VLQNADQSALTGATFPLISLSGPVERVQDEAKFGEGSGTLPYYI
jgi:hypothetical protein